MGINVAQLLRHWALSDPERVALVCWDEGERRELRYAELDARARVASARLAEQGIARGTRMAISVQNGLGFLDAWFGGLYRGATLLPIPPMSAAPELRFRLRHAACAALITDDSTQRLGQEALVGAPGTRALSCASLQEGPASPDGPCDLPAESTAMVLYTSGTTGTPKGAMITHASLFTHTAALVHHALSLRAQDVVLAALPLTHSYGLRMTLLAPFFAGACVVLLDRFEPERVKRTLAAEQVSWFPGVPTMFHALANSTQAAVPLPHLRWCLSAGAALPRELRLRAEAALGVPVRQGFGLSEATFTSVASPDDVGGEETVGRPVFGVEVRIVDAGGDVLPADTPGEVCIRGQNVMAGYLDDDAATRAALGSGWLRSGDVGQLDAHGRLTIVDRIKDLILRGGFNVYPAEVEAVLLEHPAVFDAVVVGLTDPRYGEEVVAVIVQREGVALDLGELAAFCRARLSATKLPRLLGRIAAMPIGASGKVQRRVIRDEVRQGVLALTPLPKLGAGVHG